MTPYYYPLTVYRGDSHRWQFVFWEDAAKIDPVDLIGVTVASAIRQGSTLTALSCVVTGNAVDVVLTAYMSQTLEIVAGTWDLQFTYPSGEVQTPVSGDVHLRADVTGSAA